MNGSLRKQLVKWHVEEGLGTPTMAKRLNQMGYDVEQRTVWRWLKQEGISRKGKTK
jgi:transposase